MRWTTTYRTHRLEFLHVVVVVVVVVVIVVVEVLGGGIQLENTMAFATEPADCRVRLVGGLRAWSCAFSAERKFGVATRGSEMYRMKR